MDSIVTPSNRAMQFYNYAKEHPEDLPFLRQRFSELFTENASFVKEDLPHFFEVLQSASQKVVKAFSLAISPNLAKQMFNFIKKNPEQKPEEVRAYITLRHCKDIRQLNAEYILDKMEAAHITNKYFQYKFAMLALKHDISGFIQQLTEFDIQDPYHTKRLAEVSLYLSAHSFFSDYNEFNFDGSLIRDEFYLRGLMRSSDVFYDLLDDNDFLESLQLLSPKTLGFLYDTFDFCPKTLQSALDKYDEILPRRKRIFDYIEDSSPDLIVESVQKKEKPMKPLTASASKELFISLFQNPCSYIKLNLRSDFLHFAMDDRDKHSFLAMIFLIKSIYLIKSIEDPDDRLKIIEVKDFLHEIDSFKDPGAPFAAVAIALEGIKKGYHLIEQLSHLPEEDKDQYPKMCSLLISACGRLSSTTDKIKWEVLIKKKWKGPNSRKHFIFFVAELLLAEKLSDNNRKEILRQFIEKKELHKPGIFTKTLIDFSFCLSRGSTKQLIRGESPTKILRESQLFFINQLGSPFGLSLSSETFNKLKYTQEIAYYAQSLEKLANPDEKEAMSRFFFKFMESIATMKIAEERDTKELLALFGTYKLNLELWKQGTKWTVAELMKKYNYEISGNETLNIQNALQESFSQKHLQVRDYPLFYKYAFDKTISIAPKFDGKTFGKYYRDYKTLREEQKKEVHSHLFCELFEATDKAKQNSIIKQIKKIFGKDSDFYVDLLNWEKELSQKNQKKDNVFENYKNHKIIRSGDPYILFRVGSIGGETCLRVTGDPAKTKSLLGFPSDGKNQVIYVQFGENEPEACAILRFFYACNPIADQMGHHQPVFPVLYLEPVYPGSTESLLKDCITFSAIECAQLLGVPIVRRYKIQEKQGDEKGYDYLLGTINGPAPFEHYDGLPFLPVKPNNSFDETMGSEEHCYGWIDGSQIKLIVNPNK